MKKIEIIGDDETIARILNYAKYYSDNFVANSPLEINLIDLNTEKIIK